MHGKGRRILRILFLLPATFNTLSSIPTKDFIPIGLQFCSKNTRNTNHKHVIENFSEEFHMKSIFCLFMFQQPNHNIKFNFSR